MKVDDIAALRDAGLREIEAAATLEALRGAETAVLGKRAPIGTLQGMLGGLDAEQRKAAGAAINEARRALESAVAVRRSALSEQERMVQLAADRLDLTEVVGAPLPGHLHLITQTIQDLEDIFLGMGFQVFEGPEVETDEHNFEALNFPPAHPARTMHDTFWVNLGNEEEVLLRTHTSPMQIRVMRSIKPPIYAVMPGRCYRRDTPDARHLPTFHQIEALVIDRGIHMGQLAGTIDTFIQAYFGRDDLETRLRPGFFPFTEPSAEFEITCPFCVGKGCRVCSQVGWLELGGCGMVHPNVLRAGGIDPEEWTGFAWGFGIDRLAMNRHGIDDLRHFLDNDIRFLSQF